MPSFHVRRRLHQLRSSSFKTDHVEDSAAGSADNVPSSLSKKPDTSQNLTKSSNIAASDTKNATYVIQPKSQPSITNPIGLTLVDSPDHGHIKADIVFIHGLGGTSHMTWSKDRNIQFFWPGVFLPLEPELCQTRIFTYGYDADVKSGSRTSSSILTFAKKLLYDLKYAVADEIATMAIGQVPLIFVAHSMGGLIVKEAYICGQLDPDYSHLIEAVLALVFLSTPHRGSNLAETLNRILRVSPLSTPKPYVNELIQGSFTIQKINEQFRHMAP
ncbi:Alpha/Beta hydrolase fold [Rhypophila sp. PSN 637]